MTLQINPSLLTAPSIKAGSTSKGAPDLHDEDLRQVCETFESIFTQQLFKTMRATVDESGLLPKSQADEIFSGLMDQHVAQDLASNKSLGISEMLLAQLQKDKS